MVEGGLGPGRGQTDERKREPGERGFLKSPLPGGPPRGLVSGKAELLPKVFWTQNIVKAAACSETRSPGFSTC